MFGNGITGIIKSMITDEKKKEFINDTTANARAFLAGATADKTLQDDETGFVCMLTEINGNMIVVPCAIKATPNEKAIITREFEPIPFTEIAESIIDGFLNGEAE